MIWSQQCSTPSRNKISKDDKDQYNNDGAFLNPGILGSMSIQEFLNNSHAMMPSLSRIFISSLINCAHERALQDLLSMKKGLIHNIHFELYFKTQTDHNHC